MTPDPRTRQPWLAPTLRGYRPSWIGPDVVAGLSAGAVVVPQAMAYATIANLPPEVGLYTCIVPMLVYAMLGGSRAMSVSTTSTIATLSATTLVSVGIAAGSDDALGSLITLTVLVGLILLGLRLLRLGSLIENISGATLLGVQVGVGLTVAVGQLPKLFGVEWNFTGHGFIRSIVALVEALPSLNWPTVALSAGSIVALFLLKRFAPRIPAALLVVAAGILLVAFTGIRDLGVDLITPVPQGFPVPRLPDLQDIGALVPGALGIALMAFLETVAVARQIRRPDEPQIDSNQELTADGTANVVSAFFGGMPAAGGFSQSAVNRNAGARSQLAGLTTVVLAILVALFLGPVLSLLPQASLAALVFVAVVGLIDIPRFLRLARINRIEFWIALVTAILGLTAGLLAAVFAGVVITLFLVLKEINTPHIVTVRRDDDILVLRLDRGLYTANVLEYERTILTLAGQDERPSPVLILDLDRLLGISTTVLDALADLDRELAARGVSLHIAGMPEPALVVAKRVSWFQGIEAQGRAHESVADALAELT